eukprot:747602-Hanusia_phi.AAC.6
MLLLPPATVIPSLAILQSTAGIIKYFTHYPTCKRRWRAADSSTYQTGPEPGLTVELRPGAARRDRDRHYPIGWSGDGDEPSSETQTLALSRPVPYGHV